MKTLLVDDHILFREGLAMLITQGFAQAQLMQAGSIGESLALISEQGDVDLVLLDLALPDSSGMSGLLRVREHAPEVTVVVLSADETPETVMAAIEAGAAGFIPKTARLGVMQEALRVVLDGGVYLPEAVLTRSPVPTAAPEDTGGSLGLSPRQLDVLKLLIEGKPNKLICRELALSESTVKTHLAAIFRRLNANSRTQAVVAAARLGLRLHPH
ncbi:response regulator [Sphaerotilaceae bacterium SBD11-9]